MSNDDTTNGTGTISRAVAMLRMLAESDEPVTVSGTAERLGLPGSTAHRLLQLLMREGMVVHLPSSRRYDVGVEYLRLASLIASRRDVTQIAQPFMRTIVEACSESCLLGLYRPHERDMMFVAQVESPHALRFHIPMHTPLPVIWGCSGRVILAYLPEDEVDEIVHAAGRAPATEAKPPELEEFKSRTLATIRDRGYDCTWGEKIPDSVGIAAPVFAVDRGIVGSLSVSIPTARFKTNSQGELGALLSATAQELSTALGSI